jgi:hypothetical protein
LTKIGAGLLLVLALATPAVAQGTAGPGTGQTGVLFGAGVSFLNAEEETYTGFTIDVRKNVYAATSMDVGVVGDLSFHRKSFDEFDASFSLLSFMGGVRVTASQLDRVAPFGQVLFGAVRGSEDSDFCDEECSETEMAIGFGGGIDVRLTDRVNFRGQLDFFRVFTEDEGTNAVRFMIGISALLGGS